MVSPPIDVCITVDTEFSIGGAFAAPASRQPVGIAHVDCKVNGAGQGLPFILATLQRYGVTATFFVEALNTAWFGDRPMGQVVERILRADQDVQLHVHPCWLTFRNQGWAQNLGAAPPVDACSALGDAALDDVIGTGLAALDRWGVSSPVAMRAGNLDAGRATYRAMRRHGLTIASNIGVGYRWPRDPDLVIFAGGRLIEDVLEVPVLSYIERSRLGMKRYRLLTITATSFAETRALLDRAADTRLSPLVLLTHPFEFIKGAVPGRGQPQRNRINQVRLERLCAHLVANSDRFRTRSFSAGATNWRGSGIVPKPAPSVPTTAAVARLLLNKANDVFAWL